MPGLKRSLIAASQELLSHPQNNDRIGDLFNVEFQDDVLRSNRPFIYNAPSNIMIKGKTQNYNYEIPIDLTGYYMVGQYTFPGGETVNRELQDDFPRPKIFSRANSTSGMNYIAYYFDDIELENGADTNAKIAVITAKLVERNTVYAAID